MACVSREQYIPTLYITPACLAFLRPLALALSGSANASGLVAALYERAGPPKACGKGYANSQICVSVQYKLLFIFFAYPASNLDHNHDYHQVGNPTSSSVTLFMGTKHHSSAWIDSSTYSKTTTVSTSFTTDSATVTTYTDVAVETCGSTIISAKRSELELDERQSPNQFGARCNVNGIEPNKVEAACSCLPGFTYRGKRPRATLTTTATTTTQTSQTVVPSVIPAHPTQTLSRFWLFPRFRNGPDQGTRLQGYLARTTDGRLYLTNNYNTRSGQDFFLNPDTQLWMIGLGSANQDFAYYTLFTQTKFADGDGGPLPIKINFSDPKQPPDGAPIDNEYKPMQGVISDSGCPTFMATAPDPSVIHDYDVVFYLCSDGTNRYLHAGATVSFPSGCSAVTLEVAESFADPPSSG